MKKFTFASIALAISVLATSCNTKTNSEKDHDSNDTSLILEKKDVEGSVQTNVDVPSEDTSVVPTEVLTLKPGKKNLSYEEESSSKTGTWTMEVTNNGSVPIKGSDYDIAYVEVVEEWVGSEDNGGLDDVDHARTQSGVDVEPNQTVKIILKASGGCQDMKSPKIINTSNKK